jgi:O-antigen ligase
MTTAALVLFLAVACIALPGYVVVAGLPAVWALLRILLPPATTLFSAGPVDVSPSDVVLIILAGKLAVSVVTTRELAAHGPLYAAAALFLVVNLVASLAAGIKFGQPQLLRCGAAWARLFSEMLLIPIAAQAVRTLPQARVAIRVLLATLAALAGIQFINYFGAGHGIIVGEVQGAERGELRYFGPVGDSIGVVLLLGYSAALCSASITATALFLGGVLLTAGLGSLLGVAVATALFLVFGTRGSAVRNFLRRYLWLLPLLVFAALAGGAYFARPLAGTLADRLTTGSFSQSASQRLASATLASAMIADNPVLGVGFMGYEPALAHYGGENYFDLERPDGATANANNQFLQSLADAGLPGLAAFAALIFCAARLFLRIARRAEDPLTSTFFLATFLWLLTQVFGNLAAVWLVPSSFVARLLWIALGMAVAVERLLPQTAGANPARARVAAAPPQLIPA